MPRSIIVCNAVLLLCLSALAGLGLPVLLGKEHPLAADAGAVWVFAFVAMVTGIVMLATELLSGHRLLALGACAGVAVGSACLHGVGPNSAVAEWAWIAGLLAVVLWFAVLASVARANR